MTKFLPDLSCCEVEGGKYSLSLYRGLEGLERLESVWHQLADTLSHKRFYHCYPWYRSYLEFLEDDPDSVFFFLFVRGPTPVAVFPLKYMQRNICGMPLRCMEIPNNGHMSLGDFIFDRTADNAALLRILADNIRRLSGKVWDLIHVPNLLEDSAVMFARLHAPVFLSVSTLTHRSNHVTCDMPYERMVERFKGEFPRNLRRLQRRAAELGKLEFHSYRTLEDIQQHFPELLEVEASGWKGPGGTKTAISGDKSIRLFYENLMHGFGAKGQCMLNLLSLNEKCIAGQFCLLVDGTLYILKIGFDESRAAIAPGNLLMGELMRLCAADSQIKTVSFVTDCEWNFLWGAESAMVYSHYLFNPRTVRGWAGYSACRGKNLVCKVLGRERRKRLRNRD